MLLIKQELGGTRGGYCEHVQHSLRFALPRLEIAVL